MGFGDGLRVKTYIYIYIEREREGEGGRERDPRDIWRRKMLKRLIIK